MIEINQVMTLVAINSVALICNPRGTITKTRNNTMTAAADKNGNIEHMIASDICSIHGCPEEWGYAA
jgi:hypothetical protein